MSKETLLQNFKSDLLAMHEDDLYFVLGVILPNGTDVESVITELIYEKAKI